MEQLRGPWAGLQLPQPHSCWTAGTVPKVTVNPSLLVPLDLKVDPAIQQQKNSCKKEEMKVLNDKFASLIGKVSRTREVPKLRPAPLGAL